MTSLRPAFETILRHSDHAVTLRASLRAAVNITTLDGGLPAVLERLARGHLSTVKAVIRASATDRHQAERFLSGIDRQPLRPFLEEAQAACLALVAAILPTPDAQAKETTTSPRTQEAAEPWAEHFTSLYQFATGWLGWTPATTWDASCDEINTAFAAHVDRLVAVNGGKRDDDQDDQGDQAGPVSIYTPERMAEIEELGRDPAFQRDKLRTLKARMG